MGVTGTHKGVIEAESINAGAYGSQETYHLFIFLFSLFLLLGSIQNALPIDPVTHSNS